MPSRPFKAIKMKKTKKKMTRLRHIRKYTYFILLPDDPIRNYWEFLMMIILLITLVLTPWRITFVGSDEIIWNIIDYGIDFLFFLDVIANFFMAYYDSHYVLVDTLPVSLPCSLII